MTITTVQYTTSGADTFVVPAGITNIRLRAWGGGDKQTLWGGGGGAFAGTNASGITVTPGQTVYLNVGHGVGGNSWVNISSNAIPVSTAEGIYAPGGNGSSGATAGSAIGDVAYSGANRVGDSGGGAGSGGDASGTSGGTPDGGDGGASGVVGTQPGGGGGKAANGGVGLVEIDYGDPPDDALTLSDITAGAPTVGALMLSLQQHRAALFDERIPEPFVALITITHPSLAVPVRVVENSSDVTSRGDVFLAGRFNFKQPSRGQGEHTASISIQNVDRRIGLAAMQMRTPARVLFEVVCADTPDIVEWAFPPMRLTVSTGNPIEVTGDMSPLFAATVQYPRLRATPTIAPGLYR